VLADDPLCSNDKEEEYGPEGAYTKALREKFGEENVPLKKLDAIQ
jgi:hypothetical protein